MFRKCTVGILILLLALASTWSTFAQDDERLQVMASTSIIADVARNVAGDAADVESLMPLGADPHIFQPTPGDVAALAETDVVFVNGMNFEEGLMPVIENADDDINIQVVSQCVNILAFGGHSHDHDHAEGEDHDHAEGEDHDHAGEASTELAALCEAHVAEMAALHEDHDHAEGEDHDHAEGEDHDHAEGEDHDHEEGEDHDHAEGEDHDHDHDHAHGSEGLGRLYAIECEGHSHDHDHEEGEEHSHEEGSCDPHVWMEPHNVMYWTMYIRDALIELDPANTETYTANAAVYLETLDALAHDFVMERIAEIPEDQRVMVTNHDAFGYFANAYGFDVVGVVIRGGSTASEPSARELAELIEVIEAEGVPAIFAETTVNPNLAETVGAETGVPVFTLYTGSLSEADGPASTYVDFITYNVNTIVGAYTE